MLTRRVKLLKFSPTLYKTAQGLYARERWKGPAIYFMLGRWRCECSYSRRTGADCNHIIAVKEVEDPRMGYTVIRVKEDVFIVQPVTELPERGPSTYDPLDAVADLYGE
jgi:hypothetical protein